jgi:hypothetical protein
MISGSVSATRPRTLPVALARPRPGLDPTFGDIADELIRRSAAAMNLMDAVDGNAIHAPVAS